MLVPTFDPAIDNVDIWSNKVTLLLELTTRLILNTKGAAYQKLRLNQKEIVVNDRNGIQRLVELVGGSWGQVPLEHRYELVVPLNCRSQNSVFISSFWIRTQI